MLTRRRWLAALVLVAGLATTGVAVAAPLGTAAIIGDGFSVKNFKGAPTWSTQLDKAGVLDVVFNIATVKTLASASTGPKSLLGQVDAYLAGGQLAKYTIVYVGTSDLQRNKDIAAAKANSATAVKRLIAAGANIGDKRLVIVQAHDVTYDPGVTVNARARVVDFNRNIQRTIRNKANVITVNLGRVIDAVIDNPADFGLTNVTTANAAASKTTALYLDNFHFGQKGQSIIAAEVRRVLEGG